MPQRQASKYKLDELIAGSIICLITDEEYSRELMHKIGSTITSYKRKKGNENKRFTIRKVEDAETFKVGIWRVK